MLHLDYFHSLILAIRNLRISKLEGKNTKDLEEQVNSLVMRSAELLKIEMPKEKE